MFHIFRCIGNMKVFLHFWAADRFFFLLLLLLSAFSAPADTLKKITAYVGETVLLPCHIPVRDDLPTVEWSKQGLSPNITFLYRDGCETFAEKHLLFHNRTNLVLNKLKDGDLSQIIHDLRVSDAGVYQCVTRRGRQAKVEAALELVVAAVSEPKLVFVPGADDGVKLQCRAECWFPEPNLMFLDDQENEIKADHPHRNQKESTGCFTVTRNVTLQTATKKVTCRAQESQLNQIRNTDLYIPDSCMASCTWKIVTTALVTFFVCVGGFVCQHLINNWRQHQDDVGRLKRENECLKSDLFEQNIINNKLTAELTELKPKLRPAPPCDQRSNTSTPTSNSSKQVNQLPHSNKPKPAASSSSIHQESDHKSKMKEFKLASRPRSLSSPLKKDNRPKGSPVFSTNDGSTPSSHPPAPTPEGISLIRSQSFSGSCSDGVKSARSYTMSNRFSVLQNLPEDSESLLMNQ